MMASHVACLGCVLLLSAMAGQVRTGSWELRTADTRLVISVFNNGLVIRRLEALGGQHNWVGQEKAVPWMTQVWIDGRARPMSWELQTATESPEFGTLTLSFINADPRILLRSVWRARQGHGPVEHWIEIENRSGRRVMLPHQDSLSLLGLDSGAEAKIWWVQRGGGNASAQGGTHVEPVTAGYDRVLNSNCDDGASPVPWLTAQVGTEYGLYVGWEFSGLGRIEAKAGEDPKRLELAVGNRPDFKTDIEPDETFLVPPAFVGCYTGDIDEGSYRLHRFVIEKLRPPVPQGLADPTLAYNLYLDAGGNAAREADVLRSARFCHEIGFETFMPDAMWFPAAGDWRWDPARFPKGIAPIEEYVHGRGMRLALWCAWTNGGISSDPGALSVRGPVGHPEWFDADFPPDWKPGPFYGGRICLACREAENWAIAKTQWLVSHHKLDYLKHDCGPIINACNKKTHRHRYGVDASYWATMGYYEVQEKLRRAHPGLILENCSGGGHIKDYGVVQRTHYTVTTDTLSNLPDRQSIYDSTFAMPPLILQAYTYDNFYPVKGDQPGSFLWRSAMMGAWQIDPTDTIKWTQQEKDSARRAAEIYKEWVRPMLKDVKVHHILPRPDGIHWDGLFYWSPPLKRGTLYIFQPDSGDRRQVVKLKGLDSSMRYWVWCEDGSIEPGERTGEDLMARGLSIELPERYTSDLIYVQDSALGRPKGMVLPGEFRLRSVTSTSDPFTVNATLTWEPSRDARSYRVVVAGSSGLGDPVAETVVIDTSANVTKLPPDRRLYWNVEAISWAGRRPSEGPPGAFVTPKLRELPGVVFVSDMPWAKATAGADNTVHRDTNYHGTAIRIAGHAFPKGIWTHAFNDATPADLVVDVTDKSFAVFAAEVGVEDAARGGSVIFQVLLDDQVRAQSPVMRPGHVHRFNVEVGGAKHVILRVLNAGDGYTCDHAAWGMARFIKAGATDPFASE